MNEDIKRKIEQALKSFSQGNLTQNALNLFHTLGYSTDRQAPLAKPTYADFNESFISVDSRFNADKAQTKEWKHVDLLFQLTKDEVSRHTSLFDTKQVDRTIIETYLFFVIELTAGEYSRTSLSYITREVNRLFPMPVMILFKYGRLLTLSVINRRLHKRDEAKDVLEKVTLIKDILIENPHRAHIEILFDLSFNELLLAHEFTNFVELHNAWQATLNISELNKKFYKQIAAWYFWAVKSVEFPMAPGIKDEKVNSCINVIRLLTRLIFVWFLKEKNLVPDDLFDERKLARLLKSFNGGDPKKSDYYKAILQNLFFGTLNQKMNTKEEPDNRRFATDERDDRNRAEDYNITNLYRYNEAFQNPDEALKIFSKIPFLNGGLFDCLDKPDENDKRKVIRIDGFSRNPRYQPMFPNILFFGGGKNELEIDLSEVYDDKKHKRDKVKGLIHILNDYKFTIAENTPVEEEIALDPELLGRIFENLLAEYNPETGTTARKATGSFYTPREIVNYMVDESLVACLKARLLQENSAMQEEGTAQTGVLGNEARKGQLKLEHKVEPNLWIGNENALETEVRKLVAYSDEAPGFTDQDKDALVDAIHTMKVLDPACGSGAFPMGVLLKVVHVLHKLDPENQKWKQKQIDVAEQIPDSSIREETLANIDEAFSEENNFADYGRKLYLIENCIYGVDIQPIAVQIAKLRFFVSLLVDQRGSNVKENRGVLSLPNLETKFVAANTLIGLAGQDVLKPVEFERLENQLKKIRHDYFNAKTRRQKMKFIEEDKKLRESIAESLRHAGMQKSAVDMLAHWDPYDQNMAAGFFSPDWMFGLRRGFNIVLGNPPYNASLSDGEREQFRKEYESTASGRVDTAALFVERAMRILDQQGVLFYILPYRLFSRKRNHGQFQMWLLRKCLIDEVIYLGNNIGFTSSDEFMLLQCFVGVRKDHVIEFASRPDLRIGRQGASWHAISQSFFLKTGEINFNLARYDQSILAKICEGTKYLEVVCKVRDGIVPHIREKLISNKKVDKRYVPFAGVAGTYVLQRYFFSHKPLFLCYDINEAKKYIKDPVELRKVQFRDKEIFLSRKIITAQNSATLKGAIDDEQMFVSNSIHSTYLQAEWEDRIELKYLLGLMNSRLLNYYHDSLRVKATDLHPQVLLAHLKRLPIKVPSKRDQLRVKSLVDEILQAKKRNQDADTSALEKEIDRIVYELYGLTEEERKIVEGAKQ